MADPQNTELQNMRAALDAANRRASEEATRRQEMEGRLRTETGVRFVAQETAIDSAIARAESTVTSAKQRWADLQAEGKFAEAADAMAEMSGAQSSLTQLRAQKDYLGAQKQQAAQAAQTPEDPLKNFSPAEREWINANPRYLSDQTFQRKANAAAMNATENLGIAPGTPKWFEVVERAVYPERFAEGGGTQQQPDPGADPDGAQIDPDAQIDPGTNVAPEQQHNVELPQMRTSPDAPAMRLDQKPVEPQQRAVGRGGAGVSAVGAPPSRVIAQRGAAVTQKRVTLSPDEQTAALQLVESIDPKILQEGGPEAAYQWYYTYAHHPSHAKTRRKSWALDAVIA